MDGPQILFCSSSSTFSGMTIDAAFASFSEDSLGSLEVGKRADYTVLSQDIMAIPVEQILKTKALITAIDGKSVYEKM
jgi:predicted amidohydrolase YtcJ